MTAVLSLVTLSLSILLLSPDHLRKLRPSESPRPTQFGRADGRAGTGQRTAPERTRLQGSVRFSTKVRFVAALKNDGGPLFGLWLMSSPRCPHRGRIATDRRV